MNYDEYKKALAELHAKHEKEERDLAIEYALAHNEVNIGDIISNQGTTIKVDKIQISYASFSRIPTCVYSGPLYTKKLLPNKRGERGTIWQSNIKNSNNGKNQ